MTARLLPISSEDVDRHELHSPDRVWTEMNCYIDVWIEVLRALDVEPLAASAFAVATDFEDPQWGFFKFPEQDLRRAFGIQVGEMNVWRPIVEHMVEQLELGRLLTVEVDSWFLPDTAGVSYRTEHMKSTIVANAVDRGRRVLGYFHNAGYFELSGEDFDGVLRLGDAWAGDTLPPYVELVRLAGLRKPSPSEETATALMLLEEHVARMPADNPVDRMAARALDTLPSLTDVQSFHTYAFGTVRQCGAAAGVASAFMAWLADRCQPRSVADFRAASGAWLDLSERAKAAQFMLARAARGREVDVASHFAAMSQAWASATDLTRQGARHP